MRSFAYARYFASVLAMCAVLSASSCSKQGEPVTDLGGSTPPQTTTTIPAPPVDSPTVAPVTAPPVAYQAPTMQPPAPTIQQEERPANNAVAKIDRYLSWLSNFERQRNATDQKTEMLMAKLIEDQRADLQSPTLGDEATRNAIRERGAQSNNAVNQQLVTAYTPLITMFRSVVAPAECSSLASSYGTMLEKQARCYAELMREGDRFNDQGTAEIAQANAELSRLYGAHPELTTPRFQIQ